MSYLDYYRISARHQPYMLRLNYHHEMWSAMTYPLAAALAEGAFAAIVASKYFNASGTVIAVLTAAPMFGNIVALLWAELSRNRQKVWFVNLLQLGVIAGIASVALTALISDKVIGSWVFAMLIILVRVFAAGIVTVRSTIWRYNYPRHLRGQIVARINMIATAVLALTTFVGSRWLDSNPNAYIWLYLIAAGMGLVGVWQFSHIRVRRERTMLRDAHLLAARPESLAQTEEANVLNYAPRLHQGIVSTVRRAFGVLKADRRFREYQRWQMIAGFSFMMLQPPLVFLVSRELTDPRSDYTLATVVLQIVPLVTTILTLPLWAPLFDRTILSKFRVIQGVCWLAAQSTILLGAYWMSLPTIIVAQVMIGLSISAGNLVWNLGHNEFATPENSGDYMAVHVMLTGMRGFIAPFVGVYLFEYLRQHDMGYALFVLSVLMNLIAWLGYVSMYRRDLKNPPQRVKHGTSK